MTILRTAVAVLAMAFATSARAEWQGCYAGAGVGYSMTDTSTSVDEKGFGSIVGLDGLAGQGVTGSLLAGCDMRLNNFVLGVFGDYAWMNGNDAKVTGELGSELSDLVGTNKFIGFDNQWTVGGRLGYVITPGIMTYALIGYTQADVSGLATFVADNFSGVSYGGGVEFDIGRGWYGQLEYRYTDFDAKSLALGSDASVTVDPDEQQVRAALLYRFDF